MGFKADASFLRFLTMGAIGVHKTIEQLRQLGFTPIELERYCGSNKIWSTKVKRLRLPDLLCVKTGTRWEVRTKSKLEIKMSDAPGNPDRVWDAGLRDDDLIAFIASNDAGGGPCIADEAVYFTVQSLRSSVALSRVGPPKSASEGAERDRTWPSTVPNREGVVVSVTGERITVRQFADAERAERNQSYSIRDKHAYVIPGDRFKAGASILAGAPDGIAHLNTFLGRVYHPLNEILSPNDVDRYAAVKALRFRDDPRNQVVVSLEALVRDEHEARVRLEAAGTLAANGSSLGEDVVAQFVWNNPDRADLQMEAILVLTELAGSAFSREMLMRAATDSTLSNSELRQAAVWGLGRAGIHAYEDIVQFIDDVDPDVAMHAIVAFGLDTTDPVIDLLIRDLVSADVRRASAASAALRNIGSDRALRSLVAAARESASEWVLATLGNLPAERVRTALGGDPLLDRIEPMLIASDQRNWLATEQAQTDLRFLMKQVL